MVRRGLGQMLFGIVATLFFLFPFVMNLLVISGHLDASPPVQVISIFGAIVGFLIVAAAAFMAWDGWQTWRKQA